MLRCRPGVSILKPVFINRRRRRRRLVKFIMSYQGPFSAPGAYPSAAPPPPPPRGGGHFNDRGYPPPPPPPAGPRGYQGYFNNDVHPPPPPPPHQHIHHQGIHPYAAGGYGDYGNGCPSLARGCLAALCCCCLLEGCCGGY